MKFGPFSESDADRIEEILNAKNIAFSRSHSAKQVELWREQDRAREPSSHPTFHGQIENILLDIDESDLATLGHELEDYGIVLAGDGEAELEGPEDYLCPRCDFSSNGPGLCPKHHVPLVTFSEKARRAPTSSQRQARSLWRVMIAACILGIATLFILWRLGVVF